MAIEGFFIEVLNMIRQHVPELMLFLAVGIGFYIGKIKFGPIQLGGVCGTLLAALALGQLNIEVSPAVKNIFLIIFIFALGYAGGPQFFANMNAKGLRLGILSFIEMFMVFILVVGAAKIFNLDPGTASGLVAGAATESAVLGTANEAIGRLPVSADQIAQWQSNVVTAYSITYVFGLIGIVIFTSQIAPLLLRKNLASEAEKVLKNMEEELGESQDGDELNATPEIVSSLFKVTVGSGKSISQITKSIGDQVEIEKLIRDEKEVKDFLESELLLKNDLVLLTGPRDQVIRANSLLGEENASIEGLNYVVTKRQIVLTNSEFIGLNIGDFRKKYEFSPDFRQVYLTGIRRNGHLMPLASKVVLERGDILEIRGLPDQITLIANQVGKFVEMTTKTNFVFLSLGIIAGILIGMLGFNLGGLYVTLGTGGGALVAGLIWGWYQSKNPQIPGIPPGAVEMMKDLGLTLFIACVGLSSGPKAFDLLISYGIKLPLIGLTITLLPAFVSLFVGTFILKIELPILLGGIAGQQCSTPALSAVQSSAGNTTPVIGYTITYAISNVLLPLLGPIVVGVIHTLQSVQ